MSSPPTPGAGDTSLLAAGTARNRRIGIALMCGVAFSYSSIEVVAKYLVLTLPVLQVVWLRFLTHAVLGTLVLAPQYGLRLFQVNDWKLQIAALKEGGEVTNENVPMASLYTNELVPEYNKFDPQVVARQARAWKP